VSKLERVLAPGSTELPDCRCGGEMVLVQCEPLDADQGTERRFYRCPRCSLNL